MLLLTAPASCRASCQALLLWRISSTLSSLTLSRMQHGHAHRRAKPRTDRRNADDLVTMQCQPVESSTHNAVLTPLDRQTNVQLYQWLAERTLFCPFERLSAQTAGLSNCRCSIAALTGATTTAENRDCAAPRANRAACAHLRLQRLPALSLHNDKPHSKHQQQAQKPTTTFASTTPVDLQAYPMLL